MPKLGTSMSLSLLMEELWIIPQILAARSKGGLVVHQSCCKWGIRVSKLVCLHTNSTNENMSLYYVNLTNCMVGTGIGRKGALLWVICIHRGCRSVSNLGKYI
jgi:hypothetical protein